jgi:hypothetical protein
MAHRVRDAEDVDHGDRGYECPLGHLNDWMTLSLSKRLVLAADRLKGIFLRLTSVTDAAVIA